jgi:hypothetical protein
MITASKASEGFEQAIRDAENLLDQFNKLNTRPPPAHAEVLKRAGLIMAMTAWETYVEDRLEEAANARLAGLSSSSIGDLVRRKLNEEISRLHNPTAEKTKQLFSDYAGVQLDKFWSWNQCDEERVRKKLNGYLKQRGDVVHRARIKSDGPPTPDPVRKDDLEKAIGFLKALVSATERAFHA